MKEMLSLAFIKDMVNSGKPLEEISSYLVTAEKDSYLYPLIEKPNPDYDSDFKAYIWDTYTSKIELDGITVSGNDGANGGLQHIRIKVRWDGTLELVSFKNSDYAVMRGKTSETLNVNLSDYVFKGWIKLG